MVFTAPTFMKVSYSVHFCVHLSYQILSKLD